MKLRSKAFISFVVLAIIYASVNLIVAPPRTTLEHYGVSESTLRLINVTVIVPVIAIWFLGLYGYQKLQEYTGRIKEESTEGKPMANLSQGVMFIVISLPITSTLSAILNAIARDHPSVKPITTIFVNYLAMILAFLAFWFISRGARRLTESGNYRPKQYGVHILALILIVISVLYGFLVANSRPDIYTIYHMPVSVVLFTIVIPYIFSWYLGLLGAYDLHTYNQQLKGTIYRKSWSAVAYGIIWLVVFSIVFQYITSVSAKLGTMSLGWLLILIYGILAVTTVGYLYIVSGSKRLIKIEEA